ncbi:1-phosphofructokinase family hexose kinase [Georgenia sp. Z1344]|uniref:1-phosphofructokinase family hexose kinase n=1 Tax=Georgenia sp. Z1344 TaxID=3416706 RepID=UPI003CF305F6
MIVTLTANPSTDRTVVLGGRLVRGGVARSTGASAQAGGKGVNISRAAVAAGVPTLAVLPADEGFAHELAAAGIECRTRQPAGPVRVNLTITEPDGTTTKINHPGPVADSRLLDGLRDDVVSLAAGADWVVLAGSLPPGAPDGWYAEIVVDLRGAGARIAVDTSGAPLAALAAALPAAAPDLMKPNGEELASLTGAEPERLERDHRAAADAALELVARGVGAVLVTLGAGGAVLATSDGAWHAPAPVTEVVSTVGAGDSSLFGYLLASERGLAPEERLAHAVAYGSAAAGLPGTTIPRPADVEPGRVRPVRVAAARPAPTA